jgi:nucleotide-binding universal stress UspA family protein
MQNTIEVWNKPELILVVTNFLEWPSAMPHALRQAKLSGAAILLAYISTPYSLGGTPSARVPLALQGGTTSSIHASLDRFADIFEREGIPCEPIILMGRATEQIRLLVESRGVDRVIIASCSPKGVARLLVGFPAEELASALNIPVCIVGPGAYTDPLRDGGAVRVLAAMSLDPDGPLCAHFAAAFAEANVGSLTLLHVVDPGETTTNVKRGSTRLGELELEHYLSSQERKRCKAEIAIRHGDPATEILKMASSLSAHFIVLGSPRDAAVSRILCDSVVHRVVREARCPVMTVTAAAIGAAQLCEYLPL